AVTLAQAEAVADAAEGAARVAVFRNEKVMAVADSARALGLGAVQLHGAEDAAYIRGLRSLLPEGVEIWAAGAVGDAVPEPRLGAEPTQTDVGGGGGAGAPRSALVLHWG